MAERDDPTKNAGKQRILPNNLGNNLYRKRDDETSVCLVIIKTADGKQMNAHRNVLAAASDVFSTMFSIEMQEKYEGVIKMDLLTSDELEPVINFIYDQPIDVSEENICELTDAANYLQVTDLTLECKKFLLATTNPSNSLKYRFCGLRNNMESVTQKTDETIADNFEEVLRENDIRKLKYEDLISIMHIERKRNFEEAAFFAIVKWVKHSKNRRKYWETLFECIDLSSLTNEFMAEKVLKERLVKKTRQSLFLALNNYADRTKQQNLYAGISSCFCIRKIRRTRVPSRIGIVGGTKTARDVVMMDLKSKEINQSPQLQFDVQRPVAVKIDDMLYVIDQSTSILISQNLKVRNADWQEGAKMKDSKRACLGCAVLNGFIYVAGGEQNGTCFSTVIKYDPSKNVWFDVESMKQKRFRHALVSLAGKLYAIAGKNEEFLTTVEMYDVDRNEWTFVSSLKERREMLAAAAFNGEIYATGGYSDKATSIVEKYNPDRNEWILIKQLNIPRHAHETCVADGKLYVVGGWNVTSVEVYDVNDDEWQHWGELDKIRNRSAVFAL